MFSSIMETVLTKFLGTYVDGLKNNMDVNIITGNATIQKISLRPQFINSLGLPFILKYSHISKILVNVPWANLKQKPTTVTVQGLYVLLSLKYDDEDFDIQPTKKIKPIIARVKEQIKKKWEQKQSSKTQTFAQKSIIRIIDNLVVSIDQIHVRVQSIKRGWDFSFGVIIDKISSFTVNQYGQKSFYTRHFTNKESNPPLKKSFTCQRFQIYFNDEQDFFLCDKTKNQQIKALLMQPFAVKSQTPLIKKPINSLLKLPPTPQFKQSYKLKNLTRFSFDIVAEQKLSADKKYIVEVKGQLPKVNFSINDIQLSQILVVMQLIYEWVIDRQKNGRRNNNFDEKTQNQFKKILKKFAKQQKTTTQQLQKLYRIASQTPVDKLQNAADNLIKQQRIQRQMKKINKLANKQKSKQMFEKLLEKMDNQNQQIIQLFQHIIIQLNIPQFKLTCLKVNSTLLEIGVSSIMTDIKLVLTKHTLITICISEPFIKVFDKNEPKNLIIYKNAQYSKQPFAEFGLTLLNKSPPIIKVNLKKRYIQLNQLTLSHLITWVSLIKLKPSILNFINEQINYSIHITQQIFAALFNHSDFSLNLNLQVPILAVRFDYALLEYNIGTMEIKRQNTDQYCIQITQKQSVKIDGEQIFSFDAGNKISLLNIKPKTVKIQLCNLCLKNVPKIFKFVSDSLNIELIKQIKKLQLTIQQQTIFQGKFLLNQYITLQNMLLRGNYLKFLPSGDTIYLLRTKMYPFQKKGKYGLIFRQQVQKIINIVLMDSQKTMNTLFQTIRDYMLKICTISQWKKYYQKFPNQILTSISQIQGQQQNISLIDLHVSLSTANLTLNYNNNSEPLLININQLKNIINYKEYNTAAEIDVGCFNFFMGKDKLIENLSIWLEYEYKDYLNLGLAVREFRLNIDTYDVINQIVNQFAEYRLLVSNLMKNVKEVFPAPPISQYVEEKAPSTQDISYLLQTKFTFKLANTQAYIIGFRNLIKHSTLQLLKYRNTPTPNIHVRIRQVVLMSSVTLNSCQLITNSSKIDINIINLAINLSLQLLFYQLTTGRGNYFLNSIKNLLQTDKRIQNNEIHQQKNMPAINIKIKGIKTRFRIIQNQQISTYIRSAIIAINKNQQNRNFVAINANWNKLGLIINNNVVLEPISGKVIVSATKQFIPISIVSQIQPIIVNISVHKLLQSAIVLKISIQHLLNIQLIKNLLAQSLTAKNPRLSPTKQNQPQLKLHIQSIKAILYNDQDIQLLRLKIDTINLDTGKNKDNQIQISLQHLNNGFRIYEPILQKTKIIMSIKDGPQACIKLNDIRLNITQEFVRDMIKQLLITKQSIQKQLKQTKYINLHQTRSIELQKYKNIITSIIMPQQQQQPQQQNQPNQHSQNTQIKQPNIDHQQIVSKNHEEKQNTSILKIINNIKSQILIQIKIDDVNIKRCIKQNKYDQEQNYIKFKIKSQYGQSYEMIEKYKQIIIKLSIINPKFCTQSLFYTVFLHKTAYNYHEAIFYDQANQQIPSGLGIYIHQQNNSNNYIMDIITPFKIINTTKFTINLTWFKGEQHYKRQLLEGQEEWVSPWINDKVTINPTTDNIYASSYQIKFDQAHGLYEINLNKSVGSQQNNYCCLTIQRQLFTLQKWSTHQQNSSQKKQPKKKKLQPATFYIKPTYFVINHFHSPVNINGIQCKHKQKVPLYSMFRTKKQQQFFKLKLGDGSMHEIYLPKDGHTNSVQLKLNNQNYIMICIHRNKSLQGTNSPYRNQCIFNFYCQLELSISFPKEEQLLLKTNILSTKYILKKQLELNEVTYEHVHPALIAGKDNILLKDKFHYHTDVHILGEYEKYLEIKSVSGFYCKQVTLYPSYYGNEIPFYKLKPQQKQKTSQKNASQPISSQILKKYSITYQSTKITPQITMYYVSILPKYYILNLSTQYFNIDGQGILKFNQRIALDSDQVQIVYHQNNSRWQMLHNSLVINLSEKKEIIFFRQVLFEEHTINQELKKRRKNSKQGQNMIKEMEKVVENKQNSTADKKIRISTDNIKIFQVFKHMGSYSVATFCLKQWNQWLNINNNLNKIITIVTKYVYDNVQISIQTQIKPGEAANHPYGIQNLPTVTFYIEDVQKKQKIELGSYQTNLRFNDEIQLIIPQESQNKIKVQLIVMYQVRSPNGRKVIFSFASNGEQKIQSNNKISSLILPAFLRISQSLKVTIQNFSASFIFGKQQNRKQLIRLGSNNIDFLLLAYPSGLYMIQALLSLQIHAPYFPAPVLNIPNIQFYLQAVQQKFIQRVTLKISKQITVLLTDKLIYQIVDLVTQNIKQITTQNTTDAEKLSSSNENDSFYTSNLNSILISQIQAKVTVKKVIIENQENKKKFVDMGLSIIELEDSGIKLPKIEIQQPINSSHIDKITKRYVMDIIIGCLGGLNLIGNPKQFMEEIQAGTSRGKPIVGFIGGIFAGTTNGVSKILSTVSNSVSQLSMDVEYHQERNQIYMSQPKGFANGIKQGGISLFSSVKSGVVGLYKRPKQGLEEQGGIGLIKGTFTGLAGVVVKSVTGVIDAASMTVKGLKSVSSYNQNKEDEHLYYEKPLYHKFKIIRPYDRIDQLAFNSLIRIFRQAKIDYQSVDIVQASIIQDEKNEQTNQAVIITSDKLYVINYQQDKIEIQIPNEKMNATGKFLQGVVLYYNENQEIQQTNQQDYDQRDNGQEIVFRVASNTMKKQRLYATLKGFIDLYAQSKDREIIPQ